MHSHACKHTHTSLYLSLVLSFSLSLSHTHTQKHTHAHTHTLTHTHSSTVFFSFSHIHINTHTHSVSLSLTLTYTQALPFLFLVIYPFSNTSTHVQASLFPWKLEEKVLMKDFWLCCSYKTNVTWTLIRCGRPDNTITLGHHNTSTISYYVLWLPHDNGIEYHGKLIVNIFVSLVICVYSCFVLLCVNS